MCGIAGFIEFNGKSISKYNPKEVIEGMLDLIQHRGPDDYGISFYGYGSGDGNANKQVKYFEPAECRAVLGFRRLSILDLSENGHQPMQSNDGSVEIIFNGEIYNYIELREELKVQHSFHTGTDTEVLIAAYIEWGTEMLSKLDGMFSFIIMDKKKKIFFCARDPIGIKPFYYSFTKDFFVFGSEPKVVLKGLNTSGSANVTYASEFFLMGLTDHDEGTFYNEVKQLNGGHFMEIPFDGNNIRMQRYWNVPQNLFTEDDGYADKTYQNILLSVKRQLRADVKVGTSLSGGIDSGAIVAAAGEILKDASKQYNTLTFTYPGFADDESEYAKSIAAMANMKWHPVAPSEESLSADLENMIRSMGEPFSTLSMFAQYKVMQEAHKLGIKVMLDGQGGDEIYLGYPRVAQRALQHYLKKFDLAGFRRELSGLKKNASVSVFRSLAGNLFFSTPSVALSRNRKRLESYLQPDILNNYRKETAKHVYSNKDILDVQGEELTKYCLPRLLKYTDRNSMAFSVESRVPHLSKPLLDFALRLPLDMRLKNGWTKYSVRKAMEGKLPREVLWSNEKKGFPVPQKYWVEKLEGSIKEWLSNDSLNKFIKKENIMNAVKSGRGGEPHLWRAISFGCWVNLMGVKI